MRLIRFIALTLVAALALVSCKGNPEAAKKRYLESGDKYFSKSRYKEASIQYRNAIKIDGRYGLARYKLALTYLKLVPPNYGGAVKELRSAEQLLAPKDKNDKNALPEYWDTVAKISGLYLNLPKDTQIMTDVWDNCKRLLARDPNSFDGHMLAANWFIRSIAQDFGLKNTEAGRKILADALAGRDPLDAALDDLRRADASKPDDPEVNLQIAAVLAAKGSVLARKGDAAAARTEYSAAEQIYRKIIERKKDLLAAYQSLYSLFGVENKLADAEQLLKDGFRNNPKEYVFLTSLAELYGAEQRRDDMLKVLAQLKSKAGEYPQAYLDVGDFYLRIRDPESAIREYRDGISKDSKNKATYQKRIVEVRMRQGKLPEAKDVNNEILKENPNDADALGVKGTLLLEQGDIANAVVDLHQVVNHSPDNPVARFNLGRALLRQKEIEQARQQFKKAIEIRADYMPARLALARLEWANGEFDAAFRSAEEILTKYDANSADAKLIESAALMGQKKFGDSRKMLETLLQANPSNPDVLFQIGVVDLSESKFKDAEDAFRRAYQLNPADTRGLMGVVATYMTQNKSDQAMQQLRTEIAKTPARADLHIALGDVCARGGRWDMAIAEYQAVVGAAAKGSRIVGEMYLRIGEVQRQKGDLNAAIVSFQTARQTIPEDQRVLASLALALDGANRWDDAKKVYQVTNKLYPDNPIVLNNLAFGMAEHGEDLDVALSMAQRAKQKLSTLPEISDTLGWIYLKKALPDNAIEIFRDLVAKQPNQATFRYHLGMALSQKGDKVRALQELKKALEGSPSELERKNIKELIAKL